MRSMKMSTKLTLLAGLCFLFAPTLTTAAEPQFIALRELKIGVEQAIREAKRVSTDRPYFIIKKVELTLQGERKVAADGGVEFSIPVFPINIELSAKGSQTTLQKLKLELIPPESTVVGGEKLIDLASLIRTLKDTFKSGDLNASAIEYTYKWTLQLSGDGKIKVVVAKAGGEIADDKSQEITFHLCQTLNRSECIR